MIVATVPELCRKCDFFLKKRMKEIFAYVLEFMLTLASVFWPSGWVIDCNILILFRHSTAGPEHRIHKPMRTVLKA